MFTMTCILNHSLEWDKWVLNDDGTPVVWQLADGHVAYTFVHLVMHDCTHAPINIIPL